MNKKRETNVREFLEQYARIDEEIRKEKDHLASLRSIVENTTTHLSFTAGRNPSKDDRRFENTMLDIAKAERVFDEKMKRYALIQGEIENLILSVPDQKQQSILRMTYLEGLPMSEIAGELGVTRQWAYMLHRKSLEAAEKIFLCRAQLTELDKS